MAKHNEVGKIGEDLAIKYLFSRNFEIIVRNYLKKYGEIDIVARETDKIHFIEVKTVSYETKYDLNKAVSRGTWRPEENVHDEKIRRLKNVIQVWLIENSYNGEFQIDILTVRLVLEDMFAKINVIENVIFE